MDPATEARADLRHHALRRCIRFYTAVVLVALHLVGGTLLAREDAREGLALAMAALFGLLALAEVASGVAMLGLARLRDAHPGPETPLQRLAQGPHPSWLAAAAFAGWGLLLAIASTAAL